MTNDALLDQFYAAIKAADAEALTRCVDAGFELHWQGTSSIPWAGRWRGVEITAMAANVFSLANGRIRSYTVLNNTAAFVEALAAG